MCKVVRVRVPKKEAKRKNKKTLEKARARAPTRRVHRFEATIGTRHTYHLVTRALPCREMSSRKSIILRGEKLGV